MNTLQKAKRAIAQTVKKIAPSVYWKRAANRYENGLEAEPELKLLSHICKKDKISLDIGAAGGLYLYHMNKYSASCVAFEPIPAAANDVEELIKNQSLQARVERAALSDKTGVAELQMLEDDLGRSTIEVENVLNDTAGGRHISIKVPMNTLDSYSFEKVGMIKIDVEGHELSVLKGAIKTIDKNRPAFIVEIEDRHKHNAISDTLEFFKQFDYDCFFILDNKLYSINEFNRSVHQDPKNIGDKSNNYIRLGIYINNFVFVQKADSNNLLSFFNK